VRAILDIGVSVADLAEAVHSLDQCVTRRQPAHVTFANAHTLNSASSNLRVRDAMRRSVVLNDGIGVDIASRILFGKPFPANLNGTDFVPKYLQATRHRHRIFLLGAEPGVAEQAAQHFAQLAARHEIVGCRHGYIPARDTPRLIADIRASHADLLLVAMGHPAQELWLTEHLRDTGCSLGFGVGALFDFMAGRVPRAPAWMRALRLEWTYRLMCEPRRLWRRYLLGNSAFLIRVVAQWLGGSRVQESTNATTGT
jgi:alpha-1,3-mannosyltransferase